MKGAHALYFGYKRGQRPFLHQNCSGKAEKVTTLESKTKLQTVNTASKVSNILELNVHAF